MIVHVRMKFTKLQSFTLSNEEMRAAIGEDTIARIKATDPNPYFKAWVIVHEGKAFPEIEGLTNKTVFFTKTAVQGAVNVLRAGIKYGVDFIFGHNPGWQEYGSEKAGQVVAVAHRTIGGQDSAIAIGYFPPETRDRADKISAVSIEGVLNLQEDSQGRSIANRAHSMIAKGVDTIKKIALLEGEEPGFPGAVQVATLRARRGIGNMPEEVTLSKSEIRRFIRENGWNPLDLFDDRDIIGERRVDPTTGRADYIGMNPLVKSVVDGYASTAAQAHETLVQKENEFGTQLIGLKSTIARYESAPLLKELGAERKFPAQALAIAERKLSGYSPDPTKDLKSQIGGLLDDAQKEHEENVRLYGPAQNPGVQPKPVTGSPGAVPNYMDPAHNELLPR